MADVLIHMALRAGMMNRRPLCRARGVFTRNISEFRRAVTCPDCLRQMK